MLNLDSSLQDLIWEDLWMRMMPQILPRVPLRMQALLHFSNSTSVGRSSIPLAKLYSPPLGLSVSWKTDHSLMYSFTPLHSLGGLLPRFAASLLTNPCLSHPLIPPIPSSLRGNTTVTSLLNGKFATTLEDGSIFIGESPRLQPALLPQSHPSVHHPIHPPTQIAAENDSAMS